MRAPTRTQESEDLTPYSQQEAAKRWCFTPFPDPQPLPPSLLKNKWGNDRVIMSPFCELWPKWQPRPLTEVPML
jgi:hypothetical protein